MRGIWWLPADPERTIGGQLTFVEREGGRLELLGGFFGQDAPQVPVVIFGTVAGKAITVCDASYQGRSTTQDWRTGGEETVTSESWACYDVFVGIHSSEGSAQRFDAFILETAMLPVWVNKPRVDTERKEGSIVITVPRPEPIFASIENVGNINLWWTSSERIGLNAEVSVTPKVEFQPVHGSTVHEAWTAFVTPALFMVTFATGVADRIVSLQGRIDGRDDHPLHDRTVNIPVHRWTGEVPPSRSHHVYFHPVRFQDVESWFPHFVSNWFQIVVTSRDSFLDFVASSITPFLYLEEQFVRVVRAMESWHRRVIGGSYMDQASYETLIERVLSLTAGRERQFLQMRLQHANERSLKQRLDDLIATAGEPVVSIVGTYSKFVRRVVSTRNSLVHDGKIGADFTYEELAWATRSLEEVFKSALLHRLGFDPKAVADAVKRSGAGSLLTGPGNPLMQRSHDFPPGQIGA